MNIEEMRVRFYDSVEKTIQNKRSDNNFFFTTEEYAKLIVEVRETKTKSARGKTTAEIRLLQKYDVLTIAQKDVLVKPLGEGASDIISYLKKDELFDVLRSTHTDIGHGGRNRMKFELKKKYANVTVETIMLFLSLCIPCQKKSAIPKRGLVSKPILQSAFNSRAQIDLIDMQSQEYEGSRFILNYQDHFTKFVVLRPLKTKRAEEVANNLLDIYLLLGAPAILHSDNGREFVNDWLRHMHEMWPTLKVVRGKPRHSQTQGSVERANRDVEGMLGAWMAETNSPDWPAGLKFVQFQKNRAFHEGLYDLKNYRTLL